MSELLQLKCLSDVRKIITDIETYKARPAVQGKHPTLYSECKEGKYRTIMEVRICDYQFSIDETEVLPNATMGLSFSATWENLVLAYGLYKKKAKKKPVDIYWILSEADIPPDLAFVVDTKNSGHYFLVITKRMRVEKLRLVAYRMSVMKGGGHAL